MEPPNNVVIESEEHHKGHHEYILSILSNKDEITWQSLLYDLVKSEQMDPWDIDVSLLAKRYIETVKKLKEMDLIFSGKVVLAAAILLKIKSNKLLREEIENFDRMMSGEDEEMLYEGQLTEPLQERIKIDGLNLIPKTPQPRKRKVSIYELVDALRIALETDRKRLLRLKPVEIEIPEKKFDISAVMRSLYEKIVNFFANGSGARLTFSYLVPGNSKEEVVYTFIPLLHLSTARKIDLIQEEPFGEIEIRINTEKQVEKELGI